MTLIDDLVAYWPMDENSGQRDDSHGSNHLADTGSTPSATGLVYPKAALFDGASNRALSCPSTNLQFADASFTISGWIKPASFPTSSPLDYHTLWSTGTSQWFGGFWVIINQAKQIAFGIFCKDNGANLYHSSGGWVTSLDIWYLVTTKYDKATGKQYISVRSSLAQNQSVGDWSYGPAACSIDFYIGRNPLANQEWFDGALGPVMVWDRCISNDEETELYNSGAGWAYPTVPDAQISLPAHYPNQRVVNIPGFGVQASRRAIASVVSNGLLTDLIAYWKLDEAAGANNALDAHTNGLTLTQVNSPGSAAGKIGTARSFAAGSSQYFSRASEAALQCGGSSFTFAFWYWRASVGGYMELITKDTDTSREYAIDHNGGGAGMRFYSGGLVAVTSEILANNEQWYFIVAWWSAVDSKLRIQVNNGTVAVSSGAATPPSGAAEFRVGARQYPGSPLYFSGRLDEIGLWKRVLSDDDRTLLYNAGAGLAYSEFS